MPALLSQPRSLILPQRGLRKPARPVLDPTHPLSRGLIACWLLGDQYLLSSSVKDIGPLGIDGRISGSAAFAGSHHGGMALAFNGVNTKVNLGTSSLLKPPLPLSVSLWLYKGASYNPATNASWFNNDSLFGAGLNYSGIGIDDSGTGAVEIDFGDALGGGPTDRRSKVGTTVLSTQRWYHILAVWRGATDMSIIINGVDDGGTYSGTGGALAYSAIPHNANIGSYNSSDFLLGNIDCVRFYQGDLAPYAGRLYAEPYAGIYEAGPSYRVGMAAAGADILFAQSCM